MSAWSVAAVEAAHEIGVQQERARILALLEPLATGKCSLCAYDATNVMALIKNTNDTPNP